MIDVGVIGTGYMGQNHARIYSGMRAVGEVFIFDTNHRAALEVGRKFDVTVCESLGELLLQVQAVSICTTTKEHAKVAKIVLEKNNSVLIEKPITATVEEADSLINLTPFSSVVTGVGHIERFNPVVKELKKIMKDPVFVEIHRLNPKAVGVDDVTVVKDLMIHDIDLINTFFDEDGLIFRGTHGTREVCSAYFTTGGTVPITLVASRKSANKSRAIYIEEEGRTLVGDLLGQEITIYNKPGKYKVAEQNYAQANVIEKIDVKWAGEPLAVELLTFLDCIEKQKPFPVTFGQARNNLIVCEKIEAGMLR